MGPKSCHLGTEGFSQGIFPTRFTKSWNTLPIFTLVFWYPELFLFKTPAETDNGTEWAIEKRKNQIFTPTVYPYCKAQQWPEYLCPKAKQTNLQKERCPFYAWKNMRQGRAREKLYRSTKQWPNAVYVCDCSATNKEQNKWPNKGHTKC